MGPGEAHRADSKDPHKAGNGFQVHFQPIQGPKVTQTYASPKLSSPLFHTCCILFPP